VLTIPGTGYKDNVMTKLEQSVNVDIKKSPFVQMADSSANMAHHETKKATRPLSKGCTKIFKQIFDQFGSMLDNTPDHDGSVAEVKGKLAKYLADAEKEMKTMVERLVEIEQTPAPKDVKKEKETTPAKKVKKEKEITSAKKVKQEKEKSIKSEPRKSVRIKPEIIDD
jgi:hypothetical protein